MPNLLIFSDGSMLDIVFIIVLKFSLRLNTIESKPFVSLSISFLRNVIFLTISFFCESSERIASNLKVISVRVSFWETTSLENTDRFVATISKSSLTSLDFNASALFFKRFENRDSIAPNLESRTL